MCDCIFLVREKLQEQRILILLISGCQEVVQNPVPALDVQIRWILIWLMQCGTCKNILTICTLEPKMLQKESQRWSCDCIWHQGLNERVFQMNEAWKIQSRYIRLCLEVNMTEYVWLVEAALCCLATFTNACTKSNAMCIILYNVKEMKIEGDKALVVPEQTQKISRAALMLWISQKKGYAITWCSIGVTWKILCTTSAGTCLQGHREHLP